jgi:hypothetical protein
LICKQKLNFFVKLTPCQNIYPQGAASKVNNKKYSRCHKRPSDFININKMTFEVLLSFSLISLSRQSESKDENR